jgi:hypothetical protein
MQPPFISTVDLATFLNTTVEVDDARAIIALDAACQTVRTYTEQTLNLVRGDVWHFRGAPPFLLPELPVVQINSLTLDDEEVAGDDYYIGFGGVIFLKEWRRWWQWDTPVVVDYDHGWAITEADIVQDESGEGDVDRMPSDIRMVALRLAAGMYQTSSVGVSAGMRSESLGAYSYTRMDGALGTGVLSDPEKTILDRYRVKKIPVP